MPTSNETDTVDRLEQEGSDWYDRNASEVKRCKYKKDVAKMGFEAGWRAAFEVVLDQARPEIDDDAS